jgi:hypothetical protein
VTHTPSTTSCVAPLGGGDAEPHVSCTAKELEQAVPLETVTFTVTAPAAVHVKMGDGADALENVPAPGPATVVQA